MVTNGKVKSGTLTLDLLGRGLVTGYKRQLTSASIAERMLWMAATISSTLVRLHPSSTCKIIYTLVMSLNFGFGIWNSFYQLK